MYLEFFGLKKKPFENTFDENLFFESFTHKEAYSRLEYVIENKKMCGVIIGAYGTGKTYILKMLEKKLSKKGYVFSNVTNPAVDDLGILKLIAYNFINYKLPSTKSDVLISLEKFLKDSSRDSKHCVVVIDEAQNINNENVFEELRMLLNYTDNDKSLLTLILSGQNELRDKLISNKQLLQRVYIFCDVKPLDPNETKNYIVWRIRLAGGDDNVFDEGAIDMIYERSGGIPRWINSICDLSLLTAYSKSVRTISADIVDEAYQSMRGGV